MDTYIYIYMDVCILSVSASQTAEIMVSEIKVENPLNNQQKKVTLAATFSQCKNE